MRDIFVSKNVTLKELHKALDHVAIDDLISAYHYFGYK